MRKGFVRYGLAAGMLIGLGLSGAEAAATRPMSPEALGLGSASTPVAMCGFRCAYGAATFQVLRACATLEGSTTAVRPGAGVARRLGRDEGSTAEVPTAPGHLAGPPGVVLTGGLTAGKDMILGSEQPLTIS